MLAHVEHEQMDRSSHAHCTYADATLRSSLAHSATPYRWAFHSSMAFLSNFFCEFLGEILEIVGTY